MLDVRRLRLLRELAHRGTIASVAEALAYTPSAVSQQLAVLEREAGVPLLERTGRAVTLTPAALRLVEHTELILATLQHADAELASNIAAAQGILRIGVFPTAVPTILTPAIVDLSTAHPGLDLLVSELDPSAVPDALRTENLDIALVQEYDHVPVAADPGLHSDFLLDEVVYLAAGAEQQLAECADARWIAGTEGTLCHSLTERACAAAGFIPRIRHHVDDFGAVLALVAAGQGVAFVPELAAETVPGGVVLTALPIRRRTSLAYRRGTGGHPAIAAARNALRAAATNCRQRGLQAPAHPLRPPPGPAAHTATPDP